MNRIRSVALVLLALLMLAPGAGLPAAQALDRDISKKVVSSVVLLAAADNGRNGQPIVKWIGSGSIISADGLILTNCHVAKPGAMEDDPAYEYDKMIVSVTTRSDQPPQPTYLAEVVQYDARTDLAVMRITRTVDGQAVDGSKLNLPALALGDSDEIEIGDKLNVLGYPGIGGDTITLTSGNVSGFTQERGVTGRAWIKTDASVSAGNSGGAGVNDAGQLVGIPTQAGSGSDRIVDCRRIADTNEDGVIDESDNCVPMGGFINALRPVNLAKPLIEAAAKKLGPQPTPAGKPTATPAKKASPTPAGNQPGADRFLFAPGVTDYDQPVTIVESFPSGTEGMFLFFDFENWEDGASYQFRLFVDGVEAEDVWPEGQWDGGTHGQYWLGINGDPLDDGDYEFVIDYDGQEVGKAGVQVGGAAKTQPTFSDIVFSVDGEEGYLLPGGSTEVEATFAYEGMSAKDTWTRIWYYEGEQVAQAKGDAFRNASGSQTIALTNKSGFEVGDYRLELFIGDRLAATADFAVGGSTGGPAFGDITFAEGVDKQGNAQKPGTAFKSGLTDLYAIFDFDGMQDGWAWTPRWYLNGEVVVDNEYEWDQGAQGTAWSSVYNRTGLPDGEYQLELVVEGEVVQTGSCTLGKAAKPTPTRTAGGVNLYGYVVDADTGRGIPGALVIVLNPGVTWSQYKRRTDQVYSWTLADMNGYFELDRALKRGETYSIGISADGYQYISEDGVTVEDDLPANYEVKIELQSLD